MKERQMRILGWAIIAALTAAVCAEAAHRMAQGAANVPEVHSLLYPLRTVFAEDGAMYVLRCALMLPVGALLWRLARRPLAGAAAVLALTAVAEAAQWALGCYYFRGYAVAACALGLALGAAFDRALRWTQGRRGTQWAVMAACALVAAAAEWVRSSGLTVYEVATQALRFFQFPYVGLWIVAVQLGKAVCLAAAAAPLGRPAYAVDAAALVVGWLALPWGAMSPGQACLLALGLIGAAGIGALCQGMYRPGWTKGQSALRLLVGLRLNRVRKRRR